MSTPDGETFGIFPEITGVIPDTDNIPDATDMSPIVLRRHRERLEELAEAYVVLMGARHDFNQLMEPAIKAYAALPPEVQDEYGSVAELWHGNGNA